MRFPALGLPLALVVACTAVPAANALPTGSLAPIATTATSMLASDVVDTHLDAFIARLGLAASFGPRADVIAAQWRSTRAAVATERGKTSRSGGSRAASVRTSIPSLFSVPVFAQAFSGFLDLATSHGVNDDLPGKPYESTSDDPATHVRTTTSLRTTEHVASTGSRVTYSMTWTYRTTTVDGATGATLVEGIDERTLVGTIDVCPDASGNVPATLAAHAVTGATKLVNGAGVQIRSDSKSDNGFTGLVNDAASLVSVRRDFHEQASWQNESGTGSYETTMSATHGVTSDGSLIGGSLSGFSGTFASQGDAGGVDPSKATAWTFAIDMWAMNDPFRAAQELWRNGRCVMVVASDYGAETPLNKGEQTKPQHDETVDQGSETKFSVNTKHRFAGALRQSVTASLSGDKKLEPGKVDTVPGQLTYTAPSEDGKKATATLRSISKRGIGTLVLDFHTGTDALVLTITGRYKSTTSFLGTSAETNDTVTVGPLEFKKRAQNVYEASGDWQSQIHTVSGNALGVLTCDGSERGTLTMTARLETRDGKKLWTIDPREAGVDDGAGRLSCFYPPQTLRGVTVGGTIPMDSDGVSGDVFVGLLQPFTIPADGGTVQVQGSRTVDRAVSSAEGTADGRPKK